jgi:hypothetical protein
MKLLQDGPRRTHPQRRARTSEGLLQTPASVDGAEPDKIHP